MTSQEMERAIERLFEGHELLTGKVAELTDRMTVLKEEAELDRKLQRDAIQEMRTTVGTMLTLAESLTDNATSLARTRKGTRQRLSKLEKRVDAIEKRQPE